MNIHQSSRVIDVSGLRRIFKGRGGEVVAVDGVDLEVGAGEIFGFLGPNGAGKTTTLRMLATLLPPTAGEARVAGFDLRRQPERVRQRIGYVGQQGGTDRSVTGRVELVFQGQLYGLNTRAAAARAGELLTAFELDACADRNVDTYSGGQRRRLDVALGLVNRPALLFLDEPTTGLDPQSRAHLWEEVRRLRADGTAVFLTTHYLDEADQLCDRIAIIDHGRIVSEGSPDELKSSIAGDVVTLGVSGGNGQRETALGVLRGLPSYRDHDPLSGDDHRIRVYVEGGESAMPAIFRALQESDVEVDTVALSRPSLDDVFLRRTGRSLREVAA